MKLLEHIRENSESLEDQRHKFADIWNGHKVVIFFETLETPTVRGRAGGVFSNIIPRALVTILQPFSRTSYARDGDVMEIVKMVSARCFYQTNTPFQLRTIAQL